MKIPNRKLKQIIKESVREVLSENKNIVSELTKYLNGNEGIAYEVIELCDNLVDFSNVIEDYKKHFIEPEEISDYIEDMLYDLVKKPGGAETCLFTILDYFREHGGWFDGEDRLDNVAKCINKYLSLKYNIPFKCR